MERLESFPISEGELSENMDGKKMTRTRLNNLLAELHMNYLIEGEGSDFEIVITPPENYASEKRELHNKSLLNEERHTAFDTESVVPLVRAIKRSKNFDCDIREEAGQLKIKVFPK